MSTIALQLNHKEINISEQNTIIKDFKSSMNDIIVEAFSAELADWEIKINKKFQNDKIEGILGMRKELFTIIPSQIQKTSDEYVQEVFTPKAIKHLSNAEKEESSTDTFIRLFQQALAGVENNREVDIETDRKEQQVKDFTKDIIFVKTAEVNGLMLEAETFNYSCRPDLIYLNQIDGLSVKANVQNNLISLREKSSWKASSLYSLLDYYMGLPEIAYRYFRPMRLLEWYKKIGIETQ